MIYIYVTIYAHITCIYIYNDICVYYIHDITVHPRQSKTAMENCPWIYLFKMVSVDSPQEKREVPFDGTTHPPVHP